MVPVSEQVVPPIAVGDVGGTAGGRWARKKLATREALLEASRTLFETQGFAATTVQQIAETADVSERTFFRYFESKDDLLITGLVELFGAIGAALARRPLDEAPLEAMLASLHAVVERAGTSSPSKALLELDPEASPVPGRLVRLFIDFEERLSALMLERLVASGLDPNDRRVRLTAAVAGRAGLAALRGAVWTARGAAPERRRGATFLADLDEAFALLADGCPLPAADAARGAGGARRRPAAGLGAGSRPAGEPVTSLPTPPRSRSLRR